MVELQLVEPEEVVEDIQQLGIGGGGAGSAGATCCTGSGGYSGGSGGSYDPSLSSQNGLYGHVTDRCGGFHWEAGGYYSGIPAVDYAGNSTEYLYGGMGGLSYYIGHRGGDRRNCRKRWKYKSKF